MKKRLIIGNWKMYVETPEQAESFAKGLRAKMRTLKGVDVALAPSFILIPAVAEALNRSTITVGAQAVSQYHANAHTGETSAKMIRAAGASFVILGHSERRALGETNEVVRTQVLEAGAAGLGIVLCVGEVERDIGGDYFAFIKAELTSALVNLPKKSLSKLVIAYEPVWAIGKSANDAMKPQDVHEAIIYIRKILTELFERLPAQRIPILYGGSVEAENAAALLKEGAVNGFLVGHASASLETFLPILNSCK